MSDELRRLEARVRRRMDARASWERVTASALPILQIVLAVAASYSIAHWVLGHTTPLLSVTVVISALGLARDARPRRLVETILGMLVGILLADGMLALVGKGLWQLVVVLLATLLFARAVSSSPGFAIAAAVQSALVILLPAPVGGPFSRTLDALVASFFALLVTVLVPRDTRREATRDGRTLYSVLAESSSGIADALEQGDAAAAELALARLRRTQKLVDDWTQSLEGALAVSRIAPLLRRFVPELRRQERMLRAGDLAARGLRPIARRVEFLARDRAPRPILGGLTREVARALELLGGELTDPQLAGAARSLLISVAQRLDPTVISDTDVGDLTLLVQLRPLVVDLLVGSGMNADEARALLPTLNPL